MSRRVAALLAVASLALGCSASTTSTSGDGGGGGNGGGGFTSGVCPSSLPALGSVCAASLAAVSCEYGADLNPACNHLVTCTAGAWQSSLPGEKPATCPTPAAAGISCPSTYPAALKAGACAQSGAACGYPQGRCECSLPTGGPLSGNQALAWLCDAPAAGCPTPRPIIGSDCTTPDETCGYGECTIPDGITEQCLSGVWQLTPAGCPL